jgi:hypothetical protein
MEQGVAEIRDLFLGQLPSTREGLLAQQPDQRIDEFRRRGERFHH